MHLVGCVTTSPLRSCLSVCVMFYFVQIKRSVNVVQTHTHTQLYSIELRKTGKKKEKNESNKNKIKQVKKKNGGKFVYARER